MNWNYRLLERKTSEETYVAIHEVYYNSEGQVTAWSVQAISLVGTSAESIKEDLDYIQKAFEKPILNEEDLLKKLDERDKDGTKKYLQP